MRRTLLVVHPGALGDVLLARRALRALRAAYPDHALGLIVRRDAGALLRVCGEADRCFPLEGPALSGLLGGVESTPPDVSEWLRACDLALCWMDDPGGLHSQLAAFVVAKRVIQSASVEMAEIHQGDRLLRTLEGIVEPRATEGHLVLPDAIKEEGRASLRAYGLAGTRFVMVHPGSGSPHKCIAPGILAAVVDGLRSRKIPVTLAVGPADEAVARDVVDRCASGPVLISGLELDRMAGILAHATLFIGHDSGLTHLAAALAVPTLALFGPTDARRWAPRGAHVSVLSGLPCGCDGWEAVRACADKPCLRISPERILSACDERLFAAVAKGEVPAPL